PNRERRLPDAYSSCDDPDGCGAPPVSGDREWKCGFCGHGYGAFSSDRREWHHDWKGGDSESVVISTDPSGYGGRDNFSALPTPTDELRANSVRRDEDSRGSFL